MSASELYAAQTRKYDPFLHTSLFDQRLPLHATYKLEIPAGTSLDMRLFEGENLISTR
jgi:hypothetical protein